MTSHIELVTKIVIYRLVSTYIKTCNVISIFIEFDILRVGVSSWLKFDEEIGVSLELKLKFS